MRHLISAFALGLAISAAPLAAHAQTDAVTTEAASWEDVTYANPEGLELLARISRPQSAEGPLPVVISVHGGAWGAYDRTSGRVYDQALADAGYLVVAFDFRQSPDYQHRAGSADVTAAVRWVRIT